VYTFQNRSWRYILFDYLPVANRINDAVCFYSIGGDLKGEGLRKEKWSLRLPSGWKNSRETSHPFERRDGSMNDTCILLVGYMLDNDVALPMSEMVDFEKQAIQRLGAQ
jgi:hypothetical protein